MTVETVMEVADQQLNCEAMISEPEEVFGYLHLRVKPIGEGFISKYVKSTDTT